MKKRFPLFATLIAMISTIFFVALPVSAQVTDGTYKLNYEVKEANNENTSIADGYFTKPATLTVENGVQYIQITVTGSNYIEQLTAPSGPVEIVSEDTEKHTRVVKFRVDDDLSKPLSMEMHIIVPNMYDMTHTARFFFDVSELDQAGTAVEKNTTNNNAASGTNSDQNIENPPTGDESSIALYALLMIGSAIAVFVLWKSRLARN